MMARPRSRRTPPPRRAPLLCSDRRCPRHPEFRRDSRLAVPVPCKTTIPCPGTSRTNSDSLEGTEMRQKRQSRKNDSPKQTPAVDLAHGPALEGV